MVLIAKGDGSLDEKGRFGGKRGSGTLTNQAARKRVMEEAAEGAAAWCVIDGRFKAGTGGVA